MKKCRNVVCFKECSCFNLLTGAAALFYLFRERNERKPARVVVPTTNHELLCVHGIFLSLLTAVDSRMTAWPRGVNQCSIVLVYLVIFSVRRT